jgi:hypothetical protein
MRKYGLSGKYDTDADFNAFVQQITVLALIPEEHIDAAFDYLKRRANGFVGRGFEQLPQFLAYFERVRVARYGSHIA